MKLRTTLILLVVLAVVAGAWWMTRGLGGMPMQDPDPPKPEVVALFAQTPVDVSAIERFVITRPGKDEAVFVRTRGRWRIISPVVFNADAGTISQLLQSVAALRDLGPAESAPGNNPRAILTLHGEGEPRVVTFGRSLGGGLAQVQVDSGETRLVDNILHDFFDRYDPVDLLSKQLTLPTAYNTDTFAVQTLEGDTRLVRDDDRWLIDGDPSQPALSEPVPGYADIEGYLNIPNATKLERFVPLAEGIANPAAYGLSAETARVRIDYDYRDARGQERVATLSIGAPADPAGASYYATVTEPGQAASVVFVLPADYAIVLGKPADAFRDPRVFLAPLDEVERLVVEPDGHTGWWLGLTDARGSILAPGRASGAGVDRLRGALEGLIAQRAQGYVELATLDGGWGNPMRITLQPTHGREPEVVTIYFPDAAADPQDPTTMTQCLVACPGRSFGLLIDRAAVEDLLGVRELDLPFEEVVDP